MNIIRTREPEEPKIIPNGELHIFAEGKIGAIVHYPVLVDKGEGYTEKTFEKFVRSPGTRIIAVKDNKIYLQKERRVETGGWDWRLPGGKVIDTFEHFKEYFGKEIPESIILDAAKQELAEEAQLEAKDLTLYEKKTCGATVEWDLYYIIAKDIVDHHVEHDNEGEEIEECGWFGFDDVLEMCKSGEIGEGRTVSVLLGFI